MWGLKIKMDNGDVFYTRPEASVETKEAIDEVLTTIYSSLKDERGMTTMLAVDHELALFGNLTVLVGSKISSITAWKRGEE